VKAVGLSGRLARAFLSSKLTPILVVASLLLGGFAIAVTPREEEPQIVVPMVDVMVSYPGATPSEVESRVTYPMEKLLWEIPGVEYVYSIVRPGSNLTIVRFFVGEDMEDSLVKLTTKLQANYDIIPPGVSRPLVKERSIDDVPILALTLWSPSPSYTGFELRRIAQELACEIKKDKDVSECTVIGGQRRQVSVTLDSDRLAAHRVSAFQVLDALERSNVLLPSGSFASGNRETLVEAGGFLEDAAEVGGIVVDARDGRTVYLRDVADITDGPGEPFDYVFMGIGPAAASRDIMHGAYGRHEAVTIAIAKKKGTNATRVAEEALHKVAALRGDIVPRDVQVTVTRNYGETAKEKSDELLYHMIVATLSVIALIAIALGWREAVVVSVAVPVTLALTLLVNYLYGYTLNRVTLFALIFSIGILVDDAIVVVENINRHFRMHAVKPLTAVLAVDEVGNPTILATLAVMAALMPMAFVSGLMGPYMRPIPVGASAAMLFSLLVAFIVSPWLSYLVLRNSPMQGSHDAPGRVHVIYGRLLGLLIDSRKRRTAAFLVVFCLLGAALALIPVRGVTVKMLPFDNKSELQIIVDMPEGTTLEDSAALVQDIGKYLETVPEVSDYQSYIGTSSPYNFNGLVRHYFLRSASNEADIQVNLSPKGERRRQSHDIAKRLRPRLEAMGRAHGASVKVAEIPPGPPVLGTLVAEVYGPDADRRVEIARRVKEIFERTEGVVDVDWFVEDDQKKLTFEVDRAKAAAVGIQADAVAKTLAVSLSGMSAGLLHLENERDPVEIVLRMAERDRSDPSRLSAVSVLAPGRGFVPLSGLVSVKEGVVEKTIYHKNLKRVTYVTAEVAGAQESPVYAILNMKDAIAGIDLPEGYTLHQYSARQPWLENRYAMKWDGEWHITYEVFRDLGVAFAAVLVIIYILVVAWFRSFLTPVVIMAPIPLTLVGILPGHWAFGAFFTATSMIGFIALAGIVVRNSILLVDFIQMEWQEKGGLKDAVIAAGSVRLRPIVLTAAAVVVGSFVMLFDPIFQGLAISMMFGAVSSTVLTLVVVPLLYYRFFKDRPCPASARDGDAPGL